MKLLLLCAFFVATVANPEQEKKIFCVHGMWSHYRTGNGHFGIDEINPFLCTHLVYAFMGVDYEGNIVIRDRWLNLEENYGLGNLRKLSKLKEINPKLKILISIGGWSEGTEKFSIISNDPMKRKTFVESSINFLEDYKFDGLDIDWEYPGRREGSRVSDKKAFTELLKDLRTAFRPKGLLLTALVAPESINVEISYDVPQISKYLDFIKLKTYDLHGSWDTKIGINAPLYRKSWEEDYASMLNIDSGVKYWLESGAPAEKLIVGVPVFGRGFKMLSEDQKTVGSPFLGPSDPGPYTDDPGLLGFNELCEKQLTEQWEEHWDDEQLVPYATRGDQWIGYDNEESLRIKANYVRSYKLGGVMVGHIENDDFLGFCGRGKFPLLQEINRALKEKSPYGIPKEKKVCVTNIPFS
ncbi:chitinase-3-like protein 1 [Lutzomyia longipalpis]|uniref:chitinase-3-like protein 1 n=1 Tax=Lutzomyia longipalpis TaxID=7200 RepID=UPI0024844300|nr:chitinase-3-like protein 1 [Lutzomyia longipalpis]